MHATLPLLESTDFPVIKRDQLETLQVNLGYLCNQSCLHCHVNAGPTRKENMQEETIEDIIRFLRDSNIKKLDLTGGAPELNPYFRQLVSAAHSMGIHIIDRCNLTVLHEPGQEDTADFLAQHKVEVVASLPCYLEENVDGQRGDGVFQTSMAAIKLLNLSGYGIEGSGLELNLMYNPIGAHLPPAQCQLEQDYKRELNQRYGIVFNHLYTLTNMPIKRFGSTLISKGEFDDYMMLLKDAYQTANLQTVMCRSLISIDWKGYVYDCDFNQMLELP
ncbi:MAG: arsenosugar biosynthesis radical SAM protein ArsS, partial [Gammaproteobacteria bacterium]|nr:arsenosugar biosynthesis radical SAM protein ArsS [Gammaproteobacteria bacterium]